MYKQKVKAEHCKSCNQITKAPELTFYCDNCNKEMGEFGSLDMTVFSNKGNTRSKRYELCSWKCVFEKLKKVKSNYFVSLPYLHYDRDKERLAGQDGKDFFKFIK